MLEACCTLILNPLEDNKIRTIFQDIISACFSTAFEIKVAYLGPEGSFSEKAAKKHFGSSTNFVSCGSIREIIDSVEDNSEYYGVLPIENSTEGLVNSTLDEIIESNLKICSEISIPINLSLLSKKNIALSDILEKFKEQKINLTNIQSRPTKKNNWEYMFFIELDGHKTDKNVDIALKKISRLSLNLKVLGSYPKGI